MRFSKLLLPVLVAAACIKPSKDEPADDEQLEDDSGEIATDADGDGHAVDVDCNDGDPAIYPGAVEICNAGVDDDCDGLADDLDDSLDDSTATAWYADVDGDGYGTPETQDRRCVPLEGQVAEPGDCDDSLPSVNPGQSEECANGVDDNCDGSIDDVDNDGDGFISSDCGGQDCDDDDATVNSDATETWYDDVDQDCSGGSDYDRDGDGHDVDTVDGGTDCDDTDAAVNPGVAEVWYDGVDGDCDGASDYDADGDRYDSDAHGGSDCDDASAAINPGATDAWYDGIDTDCDGANDYDADGDGAETDAHGGPDCDDANSAVSPGAAELAGDEVDQNCDGVELCYSDGDGDGYRLTSTLTSFDLDCQDPGEATTTDPAVDCDDDASTCTTDCTTDSDSDGFLDCQDACEDDDGDEYGATNVAATSCLDSSGGSCVQDPACTSTDCDDDASTCSTDCATDSDSDGHPDCQDACDDADGDSHGVTNGLASACLDSSGAPCVLDAACVSTDCDDDASTCTLDCTTDSDDDGYADCQDACDDDDGDSYGVTDGSASACLDSSGASCVLDAACVSTDCDDDASTCTMDCTTDSDNDGYLDCQDACEDDDGDGYGVSNGAASSCLTSVGVSCLQEAACVAPDCNDNATTCSTDCSTDSDGDGFVDCRDACEDADGDSYGIANSAATGCLTSVGASCVQDAACTATDCDDDATTCTTSCTTDSDADGYADCKDGCEDNDGDDFGNTNSSATSCLDTSGSSCVSATACTFSDCNDADEYTYPGAASADNATACMTDADLDGWGATLPATGATAGTDCDDSEVTVGTLSWDDDMEDVSVGYDSAYFQSASSGGTSASSTAHSGSRSTLINGIDRGFRTNFNVISASGFYLDFYLLVGACNSRNPNVIFRTGGGIVSECVVACSANEWTLEGVGTGISVVSGDWVRLTYMFDGSTADVYADSVLVGSCSFSFDPATDYWIAKHNDNTAYSTRLDTFRACEMN
jgi:hypothetical protein